MSKDQLLTAILDYCQLNKMAESTFGRKSVNDGKFVSRLRTGARVTPETWSKVRKFINKNGVITNLKMDPNNLHVLPEEKDHKSNLNLSNIEESKSE